MRNLIHDYFTTLTEELKDVVSSDLGSYVTIVNNILNFKGYFKFLNSLNHLQNAVSVSLIIMLVDAFFYPTIVENITKIYSITIIILEKQKYI